MINHERILLSSPHMSGKEQLYIKEAFDSNWIAPLGPNVTNFELELARYTNKKGASLTSSGTAAIHLALACLGIETGDSVFCSSFTFIASANPALYLGAELTFIDSEPSSWNMSPQALERALFDASKANHLPKAIIVVNLYGQSADMELLLNVADLFGVPIIEDAAESLGAEYKNKKSGTFGKIGIYSFNGNKIITTSGGGAIVSDDEELLDKAFFLATQAKDAAPYYQHSLVGYNYRMSNVLAGIGRAQLQVLDKRVEKRREIFQNYYSELNSIEEVHFMPELKQSKSNRWLTTLVIDPFMTNVTPFEFMDKMNQANIETRLLWKPLHMQPLFRRTKFYKHNERTPAVSELLFAMGICIPSGSNMTEENQFRVIDQMKKILSPVDQAPVLRNKVPASQV